MATTQPSLGPGGGDLASGRAGSGFYCSTSGSVLTDRESLSEHYKSDFHRYNLKRKVAGLPPVTKEWFEARRAQLLSAQATTGESGLPAGHVRVWFDPLTRKSFRSEQTYQSYVRSNKYQELVRKSGEAAPAAVVSARKLGEEADGAASTSGQQGAEGSGADNRAAPRQGQLPTTAGYRVVAPSGGLPLRTDDKPVQTTAQQRNTQADAEDEEDGSGWETASDEDLAAAGEEDEDWEEWDVRRSLFDNHVSKTFEANLEYMWRTYGFYFPDAQYLTDPEGLLKYLGAKLQYGRVPLYTRGDDAGAKQFRSLHAVQRHMVDSGRCKMVYDDNEEEYSEFYAYADSEEDGEQGKELALGGAGAGPVVAGYELMVGAPGGTSKVLGTREFARYYRQRHRPQDDRAIVLVGSVQAKYRALGIALRDEASSLATKKLKSKARKDYAWEAKRNLVRNMRNNINLNLPKNVPY